ncbi:unnamed protein product [Mesocestoides corti]|uniref:Uncharacterized protein n=1 Tax=Mesocestoides corti TaxID=53468 RepID=A0A0R3U4S7_MESCO|nr:unnamed protein product [Mesocestoides corti]
MSPLKQFCRPSNRNVRLLHFCIARLKVLFLPHRSTKLLPYTLTLISLVSFSNSRLTQKGLVFGANRCQTTLSLRHPPILLTTLNFRRLPNLWTIHFESSRVIISGGNKAGPIAKVFRNA